MTSLAVSRLGTRDAARAALSVLAFAAWAAAAIALWLDLVVLSVPRADLVETVLIRGVPLAAVAIAILRRRSDDRFLPVVAGAMCAVSAAIWITPQLTFRTTAIFALPVVAVASLAVRRWPAAALIGLFACAAFYGSAQAFLSLPLGQVADLLLVGSWIGLIAALMLRARDHSLALTPGVALVCLYMGITFVYILLSPNLDFSLRTFRVSLWHMLALVVVAYFGLRKATLEHVMRGAVVIAALGGAYATLRWSIGPSDKEAALVGDAYGIQYNQLFVGEDKVQGSFPNGQELGLWASLSIPFCAAVALTRSGLIRLIALAAVPLCAFGLLGSGQRTGFVGATAGVFTVLIINQLSRGLRGPRLGAAVGAVLALLVSGVLIFPAVVDSPEKTKRYTNILTPTQDGPFQDRLYKWGNALADLDGHPFGHGIGTGGAGAAYVRFPGLNAVNVDSSYIQIAYEQGLVVMGIFALALLVLLFELIRAAIWTRDRQGAATCMAAAGTLTAIVIALAGNLHLNSLAILGGWVMVGLGIATYTVRPKTELVRTAPI